MLWIIGSNMGVRKLVLLSTVPQELTILGGISRDVYHRWQGAHFCHFGNRKSSSFPFQHRPLLRLYVRHIVLSVNYVNLWDFHMLWDIYVYKLPHNIFSLTYKPSFNQRLWGISETSPLQSQIPLSHISGTICTTWCAVTFHFSPLLWYSWCLNNMVK